MSSYNTRSKVQETGQHPELIFPLYSGLKTTQAHSYRCMTIRTSVDCPRDQKRLTSKVTESHVFKTWWLCKVAIKNSSLHFLPYSRGAWEEDTIIVFPDNLQGSTISLLRVWMDFFTICFAKKKKKDFIFNVYVLCPRTSIINTY